MKCYRNHNCGPFEMYSCNVCPASKPEYLQQQPIKPKTRADRLRAMTDVELAEHLSWWDNSPLHASSERWLDWLREEAE